MQKDGRIALFGRSVENQLESALTFLLAVAMAFGSSIFIQLKVQNPYEVSNIANATLGWNPETNYIRVLYIIFSTIAFYFILRFINLRFGKLWFRLAIVIFATTAIFVSTMAIASTSTYIDMFHIGEQLGPTNGYNNGKDLFTNLFFVHGAGEDVLMPNAALHLFNGGEASIGSHILMTGILHITAVLFLFLLLARILKSNASFLFATIWFLGTTYSGFAYTKNIAVFFVVYLYWLALTRPLSTKRLLGTYAGIGFVSSAALFYSIDVGVIMTAVACLAALVLPLFAISTKGWQFSIRKTSLRISNMYASLAIIAGIVVPQVIALLIIGAHSYSEFIRMSFIEIPRYQGLMFDYPLPEVSTTTYLFWLPTIIASLLGFGLLAVARVDFIRNKHIKKETVFGAILLTLSLLYLRFGVGRPDTPHIAVSTVLLFVTLFYVIGLYTEDLKLNSPGRYKTIYWVPLLLVGLLFWPQASWSLPQVLSSSNTELHDIKQYKNLPNRADESWLNDEQKQVTQFIRANSTKNDGLFVLEPEPLYYYLTDRQNPSRFYITWFADPQPYTQELLSDLKNNPPKFVIYKGPSPYEVSDGVPLTKRIPEVDAWILDNYKHKSTIGSTVILSR